MTTSIKNFDALLLRKLPRTERVYVRLFCDYGLTYEEIADLFGVGDNHAEAIVRRGLEAYDKWVDAEKTK